jgi:hypothetical protein
VRSDDCLEVSLRHERRIDHLTVIVRPQEDLWAKACGEYRVRFDDLLEVSSGQDRRIDHLAVIICASGEICEPRLVGEYRVWSDNLQLNVSSNQDRRIDHLTVFVRSGETCSGLE